MPRFRFTVRRLMLAVAIAGILLWYAERHARYSARASRHESRQARVLSGSLLRGSQGPDQLGRPTTDWETEMHRGLGAKYRRAALYPWLPIEPDPEPDSYRRAYYEKVRREYHQGIKKAEAR